MAILRATLIRNRTLIQYQDGEFLRSKTSDIYDDNVERPSDRPFPLAEDYTAGRPMLCLADQNDYIKNNADQRKEAI